MLLYVSQELFTDLSWNTAATCGPPICYNTAPFLQSIRKCFWAGFGVRLVFDYNLFNVPLNLSREFLDQDSLVRKINLSTCCISASITDRLEYWWVDYWYHQFLAVDTGMYSSTENSECLVSSLLVLVFSFSPSRFFRILSVRCNVDEWNCSTGTRGVVL